MDQFTRDYWKALIERRAHPDVVIVDHRFYVMGDKDVFPKGFNGKNFKIRFPDGRVIEHDNLWNGSEIPKEFWSDLPDNAEFLPA